jgi:hypothetical protein
MAAAAGVAVRSVAANAARMTNDLKTSLPRYRRANGRVTNGLTAWGAEAYVVTEKRPLMVRASEERLGRSLLEAGPVEEPDCETADEQDAEEDQDEGDVRLVLRVVAREETAHVVGNYRSGTVGLEADHAADHA